MPRCGKCGCEVPQGEVYELFGDTFCEDCYIDRMAAPKTCDPWAVYTAKRTSENNLVLTPLQKKIYDFIAGSREVDLETICSELSITEEDFRNAFATLRHMELCKASKQGDRVVYKLFKD
jgi:hypothetical protein